MTPKEFSDYVKWYKANYFGDVILTPEFVDKWKQSNG